MTTRIGLDSNINSVISSIDDVKDDIDNEMRKRVGAAMRVMWADARQYVLDDPHVSGNLFQAIENDTVDTSDGLTFSVYVDAAEELAYSAVVEFGSGSKTNQPYGGGNKVPGAWPSVGSSVPVGFPYESPDIPHNVEHPVDTEGYPKFYGFVKHIEEWMRAKGVTPMSGSYFVSAAFIASEIVVAGNHAHPFLRPAWFQNELRVKKAARNALRNAAR